MTVLTFRTIDEEEVSFGTGRLKLITASGLETPPLGISVSEGPGIDGVIAITTTTRPRYIAIDAAIDCEGLEEADEASERRTICEALKIHTREGTLFVERLGRRRKIGAQPSREPIFVKRSWSEAWQRFSVEFVCRQPYFIDIEPQVSEVAYFAALTEFSEEGIEFDEDGIEFATILHTGNRTKTINNQGNVAAPLRIRFSGPIVNPFIRNTTSGEILRISGIIAAGEYLEVNTEPVNRTITLHRHGIESNGMHYMDLLSTFWQLKPGENIIEIGDDSPGEGSEALFEFAGRHLEA